MLRLKAASAAVLISCFVPPAFAAFDDPATSARALALGGAMTAVPGDPVSSFYNPATLGTLQHPALAGDFARQFNLQGGAADLSQLNAVVAIPVSGPGGPLGTAAISGIYDRWRNSSVDRSAGFAYGTSRFLETEDGQFDVGVRADLLTSLDPAGKSSGIKPDVDAGALYRFADHYALGLSVLNANQPVLTQSGLGGRVPVSVRLGFSESQSDFLLTSDISHSERSALYPNQTSADFGIEKWWTTLERGSWAARAGLSLGDRTQLASAGFGWRMFGGEWDYALTVPLSGGVRVGQTVSLVLRFGESHPEAEFERILDSQIEARRELSRDFDAQAAALTAREKALEAELLTQKAEIDSLQLRLAGKMISEAFAQEQLKKLRERYQKSQGDFEKMRRKAAGAAQKSRVELFNEDWASYQKLKLKGASDAVLSQTLKGLLADYKDSGIDLSDVNRELLSRLNGQ